MESTSESTAPLDKHMAEMITILVWVGLICFCGLLGNVFTILVYCNRLRINHFERIIFALAISDVWGCIGLLIGTIFVAVYRINLPREGCMTIVFLMSTANAFSVLLSMWVAVDRYKALQIATPRLYSAKRDIAITVFLGFTSVTVSVPFLFVSDSDFFIEQGKFGCLLNTSSATAFTQIMGSLVILVLLVICVYNIKIFRLLRNRRRQVAPPQSTEINQPGEALQLHSIKQAQSVEELAVSPVDIHASFPSSDLHNAVDTQNTADDTIYGPEQISYDFVLPNVPQDKFADHTDIAVVAQALNVVQPSRENFVQTRNETSQPETNSNNLLSSDCNMTLTQASKMVQLVTLISVITVIPAFIVIAIWDSHIQYLQETHKEWFLFFLIIRSLGIVNFATDPVLYCLVSKSFRDHCLTTLLRLFR